MLAHEKHKLLCKVWLEFNGKPFLGKGGAQILEAIKDVKSITKAAKKVRMSYRYVWNYLAKIEKILQEPVVQTYKGGSKGGGGALLTALGESLLKDYKRVEDILHIKTYGLSAINPSERLKMMKIIKNELNKIAIRRRRKE